MLPLSSLSKKRQLNAKTWKDAYPLPRIEESLDALSGAKWFSTLDLASGYNQVPVAEADKHKQPFVHLLVCSNLTGWLLAFAMPQVHFKG